MKSYKDSGVDTAGADAWVDEISKTFSSDSQNLMSSFDAYAAVYKTSDDSCIALSCDGVGTKILWSKAGLGSGEQVAQDLVAMNVNDLICVGAKPSLFMDYLAVGSLKVQKDSGFLNQFLNGLKSACNESEMLLVGGETAEMPGVYEPSQYDVAGFSVGFLSHADYLSPKNILPGDLVFGLRSSGPHSNGFSWLRKLFNPTNDVEFIKNHLMPPTRLYVKSFLKIKKQLKNHLTGAFHITGSGFLNLLRYNNTSSGIALGFDLCHLPPAPEWCAEVQKRSGATLEEMYRSLNMGWGLMVCLRPSLSSGDLEFLKTSGATLLGVVQQDPIVKIKDLVLYE